MFKLYVTQTEFSLIAADKALWSSDFAFLIYDT